MAFSLYRNPVGRSPLFTPPIVGPLPEVPPDVSVGYPTRQRAAAPHFDFGFLRHPFDGGNIGKTLFSGLGLLALAHDPAQTLTGLFSGLNNYMGTRQGVLNQQYADQGAQYTADERARQFDAAQQAKADALAATQDYRNRTLAETERYHTGQEARAEQDRMGRLGTTLLNAIGPNDPRTVTALRAGGFDTLPPYGSSPLGFVPGAEGQAPPPQAYDPGSTFGARAANTNRTLAAIPGVQANSDLAVGALPYRLQAEAYKPRQAEVNLQGGKIRNAAAQGTEARARQMFPLDKGKAQAWIDYLNNVQSPLGEARLEGARINNQFLPQKLATEISGAQARTDAARAGIGKAAKTGSEATMAAMIDDVEHRFGVHVPANNIGSTAPIHAGTHADGLAFDIIGPRAKDAIAYVKKAYGARIDPNTTGYRATAGKYSSEPHGHIRVRASVDKARAKAATATAGGNAWAGIPAGFRTEVLSAGITPNAPPREAQRFLSEWTGKGAFRRNFEGHLVEGTSMSASQQMHEARDAFNAQWDSKKPKSQKVDPEVSSILDSIR
jgi:hypothetical protein